MTTAYQELKFIFNTAGKIALSILGLSKKSPNGHVTDLSLTTELALHIVNGHFEEDGKFFGRAIEDFPEDMATISTTELFAGTETLLHVATMSGNTKGLNFVLDIARERGELAETLISVNKDNRTPKEDLEYFINLSEKYIDKVSDPKETQAVCDSYKKCLSIIVNAENHQVYKNRWQKKSNTAKFLA